ncbi:EAL domain-containing protein [Methylotenera sp.]|uniref:EAL domain-containing protein n=2 Tax=Methylotenera sp. TaxID=2051956 RepID=UPI002718738C|nr:EAL domain-containing protein [Methylotenera sp.]MDO9204794.1 EAL domain-containing protein [Methylotenera sp.]MDP1521631.1 EAL domain-containing protein [Methylotenera sp.]MDP2070267.1 EAL domain-containing protein [Methylotenera sp.]MDP3005251.1 EAL domain-containing protein [Methylotenera sp.]MDP3307652.1 EAL domain-containing protein [Methylotenera sp.]
MAQQQIAPHVEQLRLQLKESLLLDFDEYGLAEQFTGEFNSTFIGVRLNTAFQPIYDSEAGDLYGHEALLRPSLGNELASTPEFAFTYAEQAGKLVEFDRVSRTLHVLNFRQIYAENGLLFLNVHPKLLISVNAHGKVFERILHANSVPTSRVVIEIQEGLVEQDKQLAEAINNYRERGYQIAIDRFGSEQSHIGRLRKFSPDFVKLDLNLIQKAENNERVRKVLPGLIKMIQDIGAKPVITGIETQTQLDIAIETGSTLFQGYFLAKPVTAKELQPSALFKRRTTKSNIRAVA